MSDAMERLKRIQEERKAKKGSGGGGAWSNFFRVKEDGDETIRILEDMEEIVTKQSAQFHQMPPSGKRKFTWYEICLAVDPDTGQANGADCPGCEFHAEDDQEYRDRNVYFINVIWRDAPVRKKNDKGKWVETDETADQLAVWEVTQLSAQDAVENAFATYKSLTNRDFVVKRRGEGFDTTYTLNPLVNDEGDPVKTPLSDADKELAEKKADLSDKVTLKTYDEWGKTKEKKKKDEDDDSSDDASESPFLNRNRSSSKDEE